MQKTELKAAVLVQLREFGQHGMFIDEEGDQLPLAEEQFVGQTNHMLIRGGEQFPIGC
ncbi:MAG: hypothetical protein SOY88_01055 [Massilioclostridium sp.]|nr:hypothetical protein [Massilioclostridium sp.]